MKKPTNGPMDLNIDELYRRYGPMVLRRCRFLLRDEDQAMDAMQETFIKLIRYKKRLHGTYPSSLLYRIATNICLNVIRDESRKPTVGDDSILQTIAGMDDVEGKVIANSLLDRIFSKEKESTREIAVMFFVDRMKLADIAEEVGLSVSGVRKRIRTLKERLQEDEEFIDE